MSSKTETNRVCKGEYTLGSPLVFVRDVEDIIDVSSIYIYFCSFEIKRFYDDENSFKTTVRSEYTMEFVVN